jgi:O-methyltransferase
MQIGSSAKYLIKNLMKPLIYRFPPVMLQPQRIYLWLRTLIETSEVDGEVIEVGCYLGGTSAVAAKMMENVKIQKRYRVYDTFSGFAPAQWKNDNMKGEASTLKDHFSANSAKLTRWVLDKHGGKNVLIHRGDIVDLPDAELPEKISACLLDVDLSDPVYLGLKRIYPRLQKGGVVLVDDCEQETAYRARLGYEKFMHEIAQPKNYVFGMGVVKKPW